MASWPPHYFPQLDTFKETSPCDGNYNCIAWAAHDTQNWWWPHPDAYWPDGIPETESLDSFVLAFEQRGYSACDDGSLEAGYEKLALLWHDFWR